MNIEVVPYGGWEMCLRLANAEMELIVTAQVGPRVIRLGFLDGPNEFATYEEQLGQTGGDQWRSYGGHRLWHAPEVRPRTTCPDNHPVSWWQEGDWLQLQAPPEAATGIRKEMAIRLDASRNHVQVVHRLTNLGPWAVTLAPWAITVMAPGGRAIVPQEPFRPHTEQLLPVRPVVLWSYTDMSDPRFTWGCRFIQMRQDVKAVAPQKFGVANSLGWTCYVHQDRVFIKRFPFNERATYPDMGCNAECFTNQRMLEMESLGPLAPLEPGATVAHQEDWHLFRHVSVGQTDEEIADALQPVLAQTL